MFKNTITNYLSKNENRKKIKRWFAMVVGVISILSIISVFKDSIDLYNLFTSNEPAVVQPDVYTDYAITNESESGGLKNQGEIEDIIFSVEDITEKELAEKMIKEIVSYLN